MTSGNNVCEAAVSEQEEHNGRCTKKRCTIIVITVAVLLVLLMAVALPLVFKNKSDAAAATDDDADVDFSKRYTFIHSAVAPYSQPSSFTEPDSPQSQALQWLVYQDKTTRNVNMDDDTSSTSSVVVDKLAQRYALMVFYYACRSDAWNPMITPFENQVDVSECHFTHPQGLVVPQEEEAAAGMDDDDDNSGEEDEEAATIACNENGEIVHLNLRMQGLASHVPDEIAALTKLTTLDIGDNSLEGPIPRVIAEKLINLEVLKLDANFFVQEIPSDIGHLSNLSVLNLYKNALTGTVPSSLAKLNKLRFLSLSNTEVAGPGVMDQLLSWPLLEELYIRHTSLSGSLPLDMSPLSNLIVLGMKDTLLGGEIPSSITKLTKLQFIDMGGPNIKGEIPSDIGKLTNLCTYDLYIDALNLAGTLPKSLGELTKLMWLQVVSTGQLMGLIPTQLGQLTELTSISFEQTGITGTVPEEFGNLSYLENLFLWGTELTGNIPDAVCSDGLQLQYPCSMTCECCSYTCKLFSKQPGE